MFKKKEKKILQEKINCYNSIFDWHLNLLSIIQELYDKWSIQSTL
jgi:hypothetical protein